MDKKEEERLLKLFEEVSSGETDPEFSGSEDSDGDPSFKPSVPNKNLFEQNDNDSSEESTESEESDDVEINQRTSTADNLWQENAIPIQNFNFDESASGINIDLGQTPTPISTFEKIWNEEIMSLFENSTNSYGESLSNQNRPHTRYSRKQTFKKTNSLELKKFFGLCLLQGQLKKGGTMKNMFSYSPIHFYPIFGATMSGRRFSQLLRCMSVETDEGGNNPLKKISSLIRLLLTNFQTAYSPNEALSLDESLLLHRGRLKFRTYMKGKKAKYGIKFYELCSADGYVLNFEIYTGSKDAGDKTKIENLVCRLMDPYLDKGHHLYMDNYYNSIPLCNTLLLRKTHVTGTLRSNRKGIPKEITAKKLKRGEYTWKRQNEIYISKWKDKRDVLCITTGFHPKISETTNRFGKKLMKPSEIIAYNNNMSGVDRCDQMVSYYSSPRKTIRWYKKIIFHLLDLSVWNSYYLYKRQTGSTIQFLGYREELIKSLIGLDPEIKDGRSLIKLGTKVTYKDNVQPENRIAHYQEKIPAPLDYKRKTYFLRCKQCQKEERRKETSWRCKDCTAKPALCPGLCFERWHNENH